MRLYGMSVFVMLMLICIQSGARGGWAVEWGQPCCILHVFSWKDGDLPFTEAASSPMYKSSTRLQWCACTPAFIRAKIRIPSPFLHAHSGLLTSPLAPSRFEAAVMAGLFIYLFNLFSLWSGRGAMSSQMVRKGRFTRCRR